MHLVSVITPSYNQGNYIEKTILSVLDQTYQNIEFIIIDGGSTDNTLNIIKKYESEIDYFVSEPDKGQADAINKGIKQAKGKFICWVNSDDILYPDFIRERVQQFTDFPDADMIYGDVEQGTDLKKKILRRGRQTNFLDMLCSGDVPIPQQSAVFSADILKKVGFLNPYWNVLLDRDLFMKIGYYGNIQYYPGVAGFFLNHENSKSIAQEMEWVREFPIYYHWLFDEFLNKSYLKYKRTAYSNIYGRCAVISFKNSRFELYIKYIFLSIIRNPLMGIRYMLKSFLIKSTNG